MYDEKEEHLTEEDRYFMQKAIDLARAAALRGEVPVGAVIVGAAGGAAVSESGGAAVGESGGAAVSMSGGAPGLAAEEGIVGQGSNTCEREKNALCHAEINAINDACKKLGRQRLDGFRIYVSLEPCPMCAGAIMNARLDEVIFGAYDKEAGALWSAEKMYEKPYPKVPGFRGGVCEETCALLLKDFFEDLRQS